MRESRKCQQEQELKHVGKELVGLVLVRFEGVVEMIRDAELMGGIECPLTPTPFYNSSYDHSYLSFLTVPIFQYPHHMLTLLSSLL